MPLYCAGHTDIGLKRSSNQDRIYLDLPNQLFVVADGMGGYHGGEIASQMAVDLIPVYLKDHPELSARERLEKSLIHANDRILEKGKTSEELRDMGTTVTAFWVHDSELLIANVGDSRCYLVHQNQIFQLTRDHTILQEKMNLGLISRTEIYPKEMNNTLIQTVGFDAAISVDLFSYKIHRQDLFLLCSDGLHNRLKNHEILTILQNYSKKENLTPEDLQLATQDLINAANQRGGQDNISAILISAQ